MALDIHDDPTITTGAARRKRDGRVTTRRSTDTRPHRLLTVAFRPILGLLLVALLLSLIMAPSTAAHDDPAYSHDASTGASTPDWMAGLPGSIPLSRLSIPATHDSGAAHFGGDTTVTQTMDIPTQLDAGIRVLDIRLNTNGVCPASDGLYVFHGISCQFVTFRQAVLDPIDTFLASHPGETVLMRTGLSDGTDNAFSSKVRTELTPYAGRMYTGGSSNPALRDLRGKLVILQNFGTIGDLAPVTTAIDYGVINNQDNYNLTTNYDLANKWHAIADQFVASNDVAGSSNQIYGNYLSGSGGALPYFVASGHSSPGTGDPRLATGATRGVIDTCQASSWCIPEFPSVDCFLGTCTVAFEGTNILARDYIANNTPRRVGIVWADFPGRSLIAAIINVNNNRTATTTTVTVANATYDGQPHGGTATASGAGGLSQAATVSYSGRNGTTYGPSAAAPTNAGDYTASATYDGDANYLASSDSKPFTIAKASSMTTISIVDATYDGQPHGGTATASGAGNLSQNVAITYGGRNGTTYGPSTTRPTGAGDYTATATYGGDANHNASSDSKTVTIAKAASATLVTVGSATYDGQPHGGSATVSGAGGLSQAVAVTYSGRNNTNYGPSATPPTATGEYTASATFAGDANHIGSTDSGNFTIGNAVPTLTSSSVTTVTAGQGSTALTVTGTGFAPGVTIAVGGQLLATSLGGTTQASATIPAALLRAAGNLAITVTVPGPGGGTAGGLTIVVNPAGAAQLVAGAGTPQSAAVTTAFGTALAVTVRDQYGNPVANGTIVTFAAPASGPSGTFAGGGATITTTTTNSVATAPAFTANGIAGAYTVLASAGGGATPFSLSNTPGPVAGFTVAAPAITTAGAPVGLMVTAQDAQGNIVPGYAGTIHVTSTDPQATLPADATFTAAGGGTIVLAATLKTAGERDLTVADTANAAASRKATVAVAAAAPANLTATEGTPQGRAIGQVFAPLSVRVADAYGNPVAGATITFVAPSTGATATFAGGGASAASATGADGVATTAATANTAAGTYAVVASGAGGTASFALTNIPGPAARFVIAVIPTGNLRSGDAVAVTATALDVGGNIASGYRGTVQLTSGDAAATLPAAYTFAAGDAGAHTFSVTLRTGGTQTVAVTDAANAAVTGSATVPVVAPTTAVVTASASGQGTVSPGGATTVVAGSQATYIASPATGQTFTGWTLDGQYVGYASPITFTVSANRTLVATFVATPTFSDIGALGPADQRAIIFLAARGIVNPQGVNGSGQFRPGDLVKRAEVAAFIARVFGWEGEFHANPFPDKCDPSGVQGCVDDKLWNDVAALRDYGVVGGYTDAATCQASGTTAPCYLPRESVLKVQVVSVVARAFTTAPDLRPTGFWDRLVANPAQYTNVPDAGSQRSDLTTYRANAGALPGQANDGTFPAPTDPATRLFVIQALYQAYNSVYGVDCVP